MHQLNIYHQNQPLDGMNDSHDNRNVHSITSRIGKVCIETHDLFSHPDSCFIWS